MENKKNAELEQRILKIEYSVKMCKIALDKGRFSEVRHRLKSIEYATKGRRYRKFKFKQRINAKAENGASLKIKPFRREPSINIKQLGALYKEVSRSFDFAKDYLYKGHEQGALDAFKNMLKVLQRTLNNHYDV